MLGPPAADAAPLHRRAPAVAPVEGEHHVPAGAGGRVAPEPDRRRPPASAPGPPACRCRGRASPAGRRSRPPAPPPGAPGGRSPRAPALQADVHLRAPVRQHVDLRLSQIHPSRLTHQQPRLLQARHRVTEAVGGAHPWSERTQTRVSSSASSRNCARTRSPRMYVWRWASIIHSPPWVVLRPFRVGRVDRGVVDVVEEVPVGEVRVPPPLFITCWATRTCHCPWYSRSAGSSAARRWPPVGLMEKVSKKGPALSIRAPSSPAGAPTPRRRPATSPGARHWRRSPGGGSAPSPACCRPPPTRPPSPAC